MIARIDTALRTATEFKDYATRTLDYLENGMRMMMLPSAQAAESRKVSKSNSGFGVSAILGKKQEQVEWPEKFGENETGNVKLAATALLGINQNLQKMGAG